MGEKKKKRERDRERERERERLTWARLKESLRVKTIKRYTKGERTRKDK